MPTRWRRTATPVLLTLLVLLAGPAATSSAASSSAAPASPAPTASPGLPATAAELQDLVDQQARELAGDKAAQQQATLLATAALEAYQAARRTADQAARRAEEQAAALAAAEEQTEQARRRLSGYVGSLYRSGMGTTHVAMYTSLLDAQNPRELFNGLSLATRVGNNHNDAVASLALAQRAQLRAAAEADLSRTAATAATLVAERAKAAADRVVEEQAARVQATEAALAVTAVELEVAREREERFARAVALALERSGAPLEAIEGAYAPRPVPACTGGSTAGYPNGQIPLSVLCPLWGTRGQLLRADAAAAFDALSKAYGAHFGEPLCVTDSYRSLPEQVAVAAAKPTLAAVPGTSNHGWGVAVDLCGGVQTFSTPQHVWMTQNAMAYGWFHPLWAQAGGSKPEAWHWEFAG